MWSLLAQPFSKLWGKLLLIALPWLRGFFFRSAVKKAGKGVLKKAPLSFHAPNLIVTFISVCFINGINFMITLWLSDGVVMSLISTGSVTVVTAFFLLRGFFCPHTRRERVVLLLILLFCFGLFVLFRVVFDISWLALVTKLTLEVILCFSVMLSELRRLNQAQGKAVEIAIKTLKTSPEGFLGKTLIRFFAPKNNTGHEKEGDTIESKEEKETIENEGENDEKN